MRTATLTLPPEYRAIARKEADTQEAIRERLASFEPLEATLRELAWWMDISATVLSLVMLDMEDVTVSGAGLGAVVTLKQ